MSMKEAYLQKVKAQLTEWHTWIEQYRNTIVDTRDSRGERMLQRLEDSYELTCCQLETLQTAPASGWENAKLPVENAMVELKRALDESGAGRAGHNLALQNSRAHAFAPFPRKD